MYKILTASADTYITNKAISTTVRAVDANMGLAASIDIFKLYDENTFAGHPKTYKYDAEIPGTPPALLFEDSEGNSIPVELSRGLVKFDLSDLESSIEDKTGFEATLKMYDVFGGQTTPSNFSLLVVPLSKAFEEGAGRDVESFDDLDVCNFVTASYSASATPPTTLWGTHSHSTDFDADGNLSFNIKSTSDILSIATYGATQEFETGQEDLSVDVTTAVTAMLNEGIVNNGFRISFIQDEEQDVKTRFVKRFVSRHSNDKNKTPRLIIKYNDATGTNTDDVSYTNYQATILNLQKEYSTTDVVRLHVFVEDRNYNSVTSDKLPLKNKGKLIGSSDADLGVTGKLCYSLTDANTGDIVIPFDTTATVVSYDADEMYMKLNMAGLSKGSSYEIKFRLTETLTGEDDLQYTVGENNLFKVV
jgi:hypothetical protein